MSNSSRLSLPYILPAQAQKHVTHNEAVQLLDNTVQVTLISTSISNPPLDPSVGDTYAIASAPTGAWAARAVGDITSWDGTEWFFAAPGEGWHAWDIGAGAFSVFIGGSWVTQVANLQSVSGVGINTTFDATNKLAVSSDATLLNHNGSGHQLKVNKNTAGDTASLLFQTGFSGRAEMGTAGNDDFSIKVSDDGSTFIEGLRISAATGKATVDKLNIANIPSSAAGLSSGDVWSSAGVLMIVP